MSCRLLAGVVCLSVVALLASPCIAQVDEKSPSTDRLTVVWTSADPDVADKVCLMYTHGAKRFRWFAEVRLIVWGPSQRLLAEDPAVQAKVKAMQEDGVVVQACIACAQKLGLVERLRELGLEVTGMGAPLTEALKDPQNHVLTF